MAITLPIGIRVAAGLLGTAIDRITKLPEELPTLGVTVVGQVFKTSMRLRQEVAELATRGDDLLSGITGGAQENPPWATFDEDEDGDGVHEAVDNGGGESDDHPASARLTPPAPGPAEASASPASAPTTATGPTATGPMATGPAATGPMATGRTATGLTAAAPAGGRRPASKGIPVRPAMPARVVTPGDAADAAEARATAPPPPKTPKVGPVRKPRRPAAGSGHTGTLAVATPAGTPTPATTTATTTPAATATRATGTATPTTADNVTEAMSNRRTSARPSTAGGPAGVRSHPGSGVGLPDGQLIGPDHQLSVSELKERLLAVDLPVVRALLAQEEAGPQRAAFLTLLTNRMTTLQHEHR
ncbi:hypothetical protein ABIB25_003725 [Nakamurella sp. UYEF19]|uniref:hypothetical protein n=1 Tax=Nakamurella sp. UYEF19 TaxID=1756392 RepID=UPI003398E728